MGKLFMLIGMIVMLAGGVVFLVLCLGGWLPLALGGVLGWGLGSGGIILSGANLIIRGLEAENTRLRSVVGKAEPVAAADRGGMIRFCVSKLAGAPPLLS